MDGGEWKGRVRRWKWKGKRKRRGKGRQEREGEEIVHGHGAGDTGVITRPRGRSGSSVCISPNSLCFALKQVVRVLERIIGLAHRPPLGSQPRPCMEERNSGKWREGLGFFEMWRIHSSSARRV